MLWERVETCKSRACLAYQRFGMDKCTQVNCLKQMGLSAELAQTKRPTMLVILSKLSSPVVDKYWRDCGVDAQRGRRGQRSSKA